MIRLSVSTDVSGPTGGGKREELRLLVRPRLVGQGAVGALLRVEEAVWSDPNVQSGYGWMRSGAAIAGESGPSYRVRPEDAGSLLCCHVTVESRGSSVRAATEALPVWPSTLVPAWEVTLHPDGFEIVRAPGTPRAPEISDLILEPLPAPAPAPLPEPGQPAPEPVPVPEPVPIPEPTPAPVSGWELAAEAGAIAIRSAPLAPGLVPVSREPSRICLGEAEPWDVRSAGGRIEVHRTPLAPDLVPVSREPATICLGETALWDLRGAGGRIELYRAPPAPAPAQLSAAGELQIFLA